MTIYRHLPAFVPAPMDCSSSSHSAPIDWTGFHSSLAQPFLLQMLVGNSQIDNFWESLHHLKMDQIGKQLCKQLWKQLWPCLECNYGTGR